MTDFRSVLLRYMQHVVNEEGVSYVGDSMGVELRALFSDEEIALLQSMSRECGASDAPPV